MPTIKVTAENWSSEVMSFSGKVIVDFWAPWCVPCKAMSMVLEKLSDEELSTREDVKICKVNIDDGAELADIFGIKSVPTLIIFKNGEIIDQKFGLCNKNDILKIL